MKPRPSTLGAWRGAGPILGEKGSGGFGGLGSELLEDRASQDPKQSVPLRRALEHTVAAA
jgi:hypothetical protein